MAVKFLGLLLLSGMLIACGGQAAVTDAGNMETRMAAYSAQATIAAADSYGAQATYIAIAGSATRQAGDILTATAAAQQATLDAIFATSQAVAAQSTLAAVNAAATRSAVDAQSTALSQAASYAGTATVQAAAAAGTATAIGQLALVERQQSGIQATRAALEVGRLESEIQRGRVLPWLWLAVAAFAGAGLFAFLWRRGNPITVIESPADYRPQVTVVRDGYTVYPSLPYANGNGRAPALLPATVPQRERTAENAPNGAALPAIIELPAVAPSGDSLMIGVSPNRALTVPYSELMDVLGAGTKGSGKSTMVRMLAYQARLMGWQTYLADAEGLTFSPSIWGDVALEPAEFGQMVEATLEEFSRRAGLFAQAFAQVRNLPMDQQGYVESLAEYNAFAPRLGMPALPIMAFLVDEANQFIGRDNRADKRLETLLQLNRKSGCVVGLFAHSWHGDGVPSYLFRRFTYRLALSCDERTSRVVIGSPAAATLPLRTGIAIVRQTGKAPFKVKSYYLPAQRVLRDITPESRAWEMPAAPRPPEADIQAMIDAEAIRGYGERLPSRRQVALRALRALDNGDGYQRVDAALRWLAEDGDEWARGLLVDAGAGVLA